jgi:hypothetical protein
MSSLGCVRRIVLCTVIALPLLTATPSAANSHVRPVMHLHCPAVKHRLVADAQAEVYEAEGLVENEMFACAYASGHAYALGSKSEFGPGGGGGIEKEVLSGVVVAYESIDEITGGNSHWLVIVRNLRTGRVLHRANSTGGFVQDLVLKTDGAVAWIVDTRFLPDEYAVVALDKTGIRTLASGPSVAPSSLALTASTLYWTQNGKPFSATVD